MKIVVNVDHGGFGLSKAALGLYARKKGLAETPCYTAIDRNDPVLVEVVEELGGIAAHKDIDDDKTGRVEGVNFFGADRPDRLAVVEIPDGVDWEICEDDGQEWVAEAHRVWNPDRR